MSARSLSLRDRAGMRVDALESRLDRQVRQHGRLTPREPAQAVRHLREGGAPDLEPFMAEPALTRLEEELAARLDSERPPFDVEFNASRTLARLCWAAVRARRPERVVEIGVASGYTTAHLLGALAENGSGSLDSIDPVADPGMMGSGVGWLVPPALRAHWRLHVARSRSALPALLRSSPVGVFVSDGLHTRRTMAWELERASKLLPAGTLVLSDDIENNDAFGAWAPEKASVWTVVQTEFEDHWCGLAAL